MKNSMTYIQLLNETLRCYANKGSFEAYNYIMENATGVIGNEAQIYILSMHSQVHRDLKRSITFNERGHYRKGILVWK